MAVLQKSASLRAKTCESPGEFYSPPARAEERFNGKDAQVPQYPLCNLGLSREDVEKLHGRSNAADWWGKKFQLGRAPFDSKFRAVWRAIIITTTTIIIVIITPGISFLQQPGKDA